jgi:hypothetical protein
VAQAEKAARSILVDLEPDCPETEAFLNNTDESFPPSAFAAPPAWLVARVNALPPETVIRQNPQPRVGILPLDLAGAEGIKDWMGRTLGEAAQDAVALSGAVPPEEADILLGRDFWRALLRGSYQGGAYALEARSRRR